MKTRNKLSILASVAALALVGTGYAAWQFSKENTVDVNGTVNVVGKADEVGTLTLKDGLTYTLVLDQNEDGGVYWADNEGTKLTDANIVLEFVGTDRAVNETVTISMESDYASAIETYVTFGDNDADQSFTWTGEKTVEEITFALPTVAYTDAYPLNEAAYDAMYEAVNGAEITFTFTAEIDECTHA